MSSFELQIYKAGKWEIDSYYDDRSLALSEAKRLDVTGRHAGVRVMMENYDEETNRSSYQVVFTRMKRIAGSGGGGDDWRAKVQRAPRRSSAASGGGVTAATQPRPRATPSPRRGANMYVIVILAVVLLFGGIAAMIALQEIARVM